MADAEIGGNRGNDRNKTSEDSTAYQEREDSTLVSWDTNGCCSACGVADYRGKGLEGGEADTKIRRPGPNFWSDAIWIPCRDGKDRPTAKGIHPLVMADSAKRIERRISAQHAIDGLYQDVRGALRIEEVQQREENGERIDQSCVQSLADGLPGGLVPSGDQGPSEDEANATAEARVGRLRGYGNSIVVQAAAEFVKAFMKIENLK